MPTLGMLSSPGPLGTSPNKRRSVSGNCEIPTQGQRSQKLPGGKTKNLHLKKKISQNGTEDRNWESQDSGADTLSPREGSLPPGILSHQRQGRQHLQTDPGPETYSPLSCLRATRRKVDPPTVGVRRDPGPRKLGPSIEKGYHSTAQLPARWVGAGLAPGGKLPGEEQPG